MVPMRSNPWDLKIECHGCGIRKLGPKLKINGDNQDFECVGCGTSMSFNFKEYYRMCNNDHPNCSDCIKKQSNQLESDYKKKLIKKSAKKGRKVKLNESDYKLPKNKKRKYSNNVGNIKHEINNDCNGFKDGNGVGSPFCDDFNSIFSDDDDVLTDCNDMNNKRNNDNNEFKYEFDMNGFKEMFGGCETFINDLIEQNKTKDNIIKSQLEIIKKLKEKLKKYQNQ